MPNTDSDPDTHTTDTESDPESESDRSSDSSLEPPLEGVIEDLIKQAEDLCHIHDHVTRVIANLDINTDAFDGYDDPDRARYKLEPMLRTFLYMYTREFKQSETASRLRGAAYVFIRFDFESPPKQPVISYTKWRRFTSAERHALKKAAKGIREVCKKNDVIKQGDPPLEPDDVIGEDIGEEQIMEAVERATDRGFSKFTADRAENAKYALKAYMERQGYLNMAKAGTTTPRRRFARLSDRDEVPHGSSHTRTMKKIADPGEQVKLGDFEGGRRKPDWKRIRDEVLEAFHAGVEDILEELTEEEKTGIREPVNAAIDITHWNFWPSPFKSSKEAGPDEDPVEVNGKERYVKDEYPEMVSGIKQENERGYKFATLTIVPEDTPIVLAIEPVRDERDWEEGDPETTSRGELVDRLLEQAEQHVEIHKVLADREFDSHETRHVIDQRDAFYIIGKRKQAKEDKDNIQEIVDHPVKDSRVEHGTLTYDGVTHDVSFMYVPKDTAVGQEDFVEGDYAIFTVNAHVGPARAIGLAEQYRERWTIENEYKTIKEHFLPSCASTDYRMRFLYFVVGVMMFNVWRLSNFLLREKVSGHLGEKPPLQAGEIVELVAFCLFDPGG